MRFEASSFGFRVSDFAFQVSDLGSRVLGTGVTREEGRVEDDDFVDASGVLETPEQRVLRVDEALGFGFWVSGSRFRISGSGFRVSYFGF